MPTISVIIPTYNAEHTIQETIQSILKQTFSDFEIVIVNDGSSDRTLDIIQQFSDPRIKCFTYENGGNSLARNRGISHATGEFISFIDADDMWTPHKLESQLETLEKHPEAGVAYSWTAHFVDSPEESLSPYKPIFFEGNVYDQILIYNFIANGSNILVRREAVESVGGFEPTLKRCADWDFFIRLAAKYQFVVVPKHQILYRQSPNSLSKNVELVEQQSLIVIERAYQSAPSEYQKLKNQTLARIYQYYTRQYLKRSKDLEATQKASQRFWTAVRCYPQILLQNHGQDLCVWLIKRWILVLSQGRVVKNKKSTT